MGWGAKKHKGSGNRGGFGMAGTGKRADQRKTWVIRYQFPYFGKQGHTSKSTERKRRKEINLKEINKKIDAFTKEGKAKKTKEGVELNLKEFKVLGEGEISGKIIISAKGFSRSAKEKIEKVGGKAVVCGEDKEKKKEEK